MNFRKINNITGWIVCAVACITYILTREATASLWDTGEFIASAYKLQLPHPPGAPLFVLLGRVFIIFFGFDNPASAVNLMSALASGFTILFLFWTITHFARKMFVNIGEHLTTQQLVTVMGAGVVGALAYTFSDSFWFSAVEGEVYSLSSFFTAVVFWAMLKWEHASDLAVDEPGARYRADRWIVFIFFMIGLSIGVHLLSLLTIPAIVMIYYFKRYRSTRRGPFLAFLMACVITGIVQVVAIKYSVKIAGLFDIWFVNGFDMPFFSGFIFFFILLGVLIWFLLRWANKRGWTFLRLGLWCFIFMMIGYSTYVTTMVRSNANPAIDMNNVDNPMSLVYYLGREQYGEAPLIYGPHFQADYEYKEDGYVKVKEGEMKYTKGKDKYIPIGKDQEPVYSGEDMQLLPRVWDPSSEQGHAAFYAQWLNLGQYNDPQTGQTKYDDPSYADNINWFFTYQMGLMYWRYFMWNFAGKQNDIQGFGNKRDGNWISGFSFIDNQRLGDQSKLPDSIKRNKANNKLYFLPFILGLLGCIYHLLKNRKDWLVTLLLFAVTGLGVVFYLNQPGNQPRERDYAYVGSFYAFAIWIGLAVVAIFRLAREVADKKSFMNTLIYGGIVAVVVTGLSCIYGAGGVLPSLITGVIYAAVAGGVIYLVRAFSSKGQNIRTANIATIAICLIVPVLMAMQEWDDHDRSQKTIARDIATDYLESCAPNAILFTFGDNDTYPLWYAQEVEGVRPDIRIINNSLLGIDWYINQLRYKVNQSDPIDVLWAPELIEGRKREYVRYQADPRVSKETFYPLEDVMKNVLGKEDGNPSGINYFPVRRFTVPVDTTAARQYGVAVGNDSTLTNMAFEIPENKNVLLRNELIILNIIAANKWKRPIYFTSPYGELGFGQYIRKDGLSYRLAPVKNKFPQNNWIVDQTVRQTGLGGTSIRDNNSDWMAKVLMEKFKFGGVDKKGMYFDEENRRHLLSIRETYGEAAGVLADNNRKDEANKLLQKAESMMRLDNLPYAMVSRFNQHNQTALIYLEGCYKTGNAELADRVRKAIRKDLEQQKKYFDYLKNEREELYKSFGFEGEINDALLFVLDQVEKKYAPQTQPKTIIEGNNPPIINRAADSGINLPKTDSPPK